MPRPKLTPEERRERRKQRRIDRKLRLEERKRQRKRDHLEREVKYGALTIKNYEKDWRKMLIKMAVPRMRQELEFAWHNFERIVDCKDFTISLLMDEIRDAEEQYMLNFRSHLENMDRLMNMFDDRLDELREDYDTDVKETKEKCEEEVEGINGCNDNNFNYLKTMLYQLEQAKKYQERTKMAEYYSRLDEVEVKNQLVLQKLKANLETRYQNIFSDMKGFISSYHKQIRERKSQHNKLKEADDSIQRLIGHQFRHIKKLYDQIRLLRQRLNDMRQTEGSRLMDLEAERRFFAGSLLALKLKLADDKRDDLDKLTCLSECCAAAFDYLERLDRKGGGILRLAAVCRKLETQKEKILPFPLSTGELMTTSAEMPEEEDSDNVRKEMTLFWQRVGQAYGVHYILKREKKFLVAENRLFVETHNEYCERLAYPEIKKAGMKAGKPVMDGNFALTKYKDMYPDYFNPDVLE